MAKKLVICCDGTGNQFGSQNSNVVKLYKMLVSNDEQVAYYHRGVGTMGARSAFTQIAKWWTRTMGLAFGYGIADNVAVAGSLAVGLLLGTERTTVDGTTALQPAVPVFVGLEIDDAVWNHAVFSKNRDRLLNQELAQRFFVRVKAQAIGLMSDEHFTVDGTLIEAWAGQKSFRRKGNDGINGGGPADFRGELRRNQTHGSRTDPEARLYKKAAGQEAKLSYLGHAVVENRNGLIVAAMTTQADGTAERDGALLLLHEMIKERRTRITVGADKAYDTRDFVDTARELGVTPHVARKRRSAIDQRTSRHAGYEISLSKRRLVEKPFGWLKQVGPLKTWYSRRITTRRGRSIGGTLASCNTS
jgi:hypothetical protein